jgi:LacI family transcriptional regulator
LATLKEIADQVGVSISTVSRVLNNDTSRSVGVQTREKILDVAQALDYKPNSWAQKLVKGSREENLKSGKIGCIIAVPYAQFSYPYFTEILRGIESALLKRNSALSFVHTINELRDPEVLKNFIVETKLDGIFLVGSIDPALYKIIKENLKIVVGIDVNDATIPTVSTDRQRASMGAVEHLISKGHKKIGFIGGVGLSGDITKEKRFRGYKDAHMNAGLEINPNWVINAEWQIETCYKLMGKFLDEQRDDLPTAIFVASDVMAISAIRAAAEKGLKIPGDLAIFGFDNIETSKYTVPSLSTIHIPKIEMGETAANVLLDYMEDKYKLPMKILLPYQLCIRQST